MLELKRSVLKIKFEGKEYELKYPTMDGLEAIQKKAKETPDDLEPTFKFLADLGLPEKVSREMEPGHITQILEQFGQPKKNQ
jgi:hypothetical protein